MRAHHSTKPFQAKASTRATLYTSHVVQAWSSYRRCRCLPPKLVEHRVAQRVGVRLQLLRKGLVLAVGRVGDSRFTGREKHAKRLRDGCARWRLFVDGRRDGRGKGAVPRSGGLERCCVGRRLFPRRLAGGFSAELAGQCSGDVDRAVASLPASATLLPFGCAQNLRRPSFTFGSVTTVKV